MASKPALERSGGKSQRQRMWEAIRLASKKLSPEFTVLTIAASADLEKSTVANFVLALNRSGYIAPVEASRGKRYMRYRLVRDVGVDVPRIDRRGNPVTRGNEQQQLWNTMRIVPGDFDFAELAALATTAETPVTPGAAKVYLAHLRRAGYLQQTHPGSRPPGRSIIARYRLSHTRNTGPRAPIVQRTNCIYDANLGEIVWHEEIEE